VFGGIFVIFGIFIYMYRFAKEKVKACDETGLNMYRVSQCNGSFVSYKNVIVSIVDI